LLLVFLYFPFPSHSRSLSSCLSLVFLGCAFLSFQSCSDDVSDDIVLKTLLTRRHDHFPGPFKWSEKKNETLWRYEVTLTLIINSNVSKSPHNHFRTTDHTKTQHVTKSRGRRCGDFELATYLPTNTVGPVSLVLDLLIVHDRFGSSSDPSLNGHLHYPHDVDKSLNETDIDKIRKYHADYDNNPLSTVSFMSFIPSTSGRLHCEFIRHSSRLIEKLTAFLQLQEFILHNPTVDYSTSTE
jgi:hypothetical protein